VALPDVGSKGGEKRENRTYSVEKKNISMKKN